MPSMTVFPEASLISRLKKATTKVVTSMKDPINLRNPFRLTRPLSGFCGNRKRGRQMVLADSTSFSAKNPTKLRKYPMFCPIELQIGPRPRFFFESIVRAHPSTAMSWVAIKKYSTKKKAVTPRTSMDAAAAAAAAAPPPEDPGLEPASGATTLSSPSSRSTKSDPPTMINPARVWTGTSHDFRRPKRLKYTASTIGAHRSFIEKGQLQRAKIALAL
mmetsp:Transcript_23629/g.50245  ORF Transcript_23629/g.50245 Transcript_23629/m.50245 type:complete len:217 (-) Transcript_23629:620-1270(-)